MNVLTKLATSLGAAALLAAAPAAQAVSFSLTSASLSWGNGYGVDRNESNGNKLGVVFTDDLNSTRNFILDSFHPSETFKLGTVNFLETDISHAENSPGALGVTWAFTFSDPLGVTQLISATATATTGLVGDDAVDYSLDWTPVTVSFGNGGAFTIDLNDLSFSNSNEGAKDLNATITLTHAPTVMQPAAAASAVPEPASVALLGLGLAGLAGIRRRPAD